MTLALDLSPAALLIASTLFALRVMNFALFTVRLVFIGRGRRILASTIAFLEALIFAIVMASVVADLSNITNLLAYSLGAAVGSYTGMWLESRFIVGYSTVTIITHEMGAEIAAALRQARFGATVSKGEGRDGAVDIIRSTSTNRDIPALIELVRGIHADAFIDVETARTVRRGWIPGGPPHRA